MAQWLRGGVCAGLSWLALIQTSPGAGHLWNFFPDRQGRDGVVWCVRWQSYVKTGNNECWACTGRVMASGCESLLVNRPWWITHEQWAAICLIINITTQSMFFLFCSTHSWSDFCSASQSQWKDRLQLLSNCKTAHLPPTAWQTQTHCCLLLTGHCT